MKFRSLTSGSAVVISALALALAGTSSAVAAAPAISVSPSTNLTDGADITVSVSGFGAGEQIYAAQCAQLSETVAVCNLPDALELVTDASGNASGATWARKTFEGTAPDGEVVSVDCSTAPNGCVFGAGSQSTPGASVPITFQ
ncbi:enediyne antibiotic chromoprotein [Streptomyces umbrinus]